MQQVSSPLHLLPVEIWTEIGASPANPAEAFLTHQALRQSCRDLARTMPPVVRPSYDDYQTFLAYEAVAREASWPLLEWLRAQDVLHVGMYHGAAGTGRLDVLEWLVDAGCPVNMRVLNVAQFKAACYPRVDDWLYERSQVLARANQGSKLVRFARDGSIVEVLDCDPW